MKYWLSSSPKCLLTIPKNELLNTSGCSKTKSRRLTVHSDVGVDVWYEQAEDGQSHQHLPYPSFACFFDASSDVDWAKPGYTGFALA